MSVARKDWSALSSLARQWSLEDEEEQQRERRRRHRALSSTSEEASPQHTPNGERPATERLRSTEEAEVPQAPAPDPQDEEHNVQALLRKRKQRQQVGGAPASIREQPEAEEAPAGSDPPQAQPQPPGPRKELEPQLPGRLNPARRSPWARKESQAGGEPGDERKGVSDKAHLTPKTPDAEKPVPEKALSFEKRLASEETPTSRKTLATEKTSVPEKMEASVPKPVLERKPSVLERCSAFEKPPASRETGTSPEKKPSVLERSSGKPSAPREKSSVLERSSVFEKLPGSGEKSSVLERSSAFEKPQVAGKLAGTDRKLVSEKAQMFERPQGSAKALDEPRLAPRRSGSQRLQAREQLAPGGNPSSPESRNPLGEQEARTLSDKRPSSSAKLGEQDTAGQRPLTTSLPPITLQVKIPSREDKADSPSPTQATFSTSLKRSSPRTISFRMSPRRENPEAALTRSASLRLPASSGISGRGEKVQETLQKYHSAVQRSGSTKSLSSTRTELLVNPTNATNVANKRHLFEKELVSGNRAERASGLRENLKLTGAVTSKLSLWVSKTQESPEQEVQKNPAATKKTEREKQAEGSLDAEA